VICVQIRLKLLEYHQTQTWSIPSIYMNVVCPTGTIRANKLSKSFEDRRLRSIVEGSAEYLDLNEGFGWLSLRINYCKCKLYSD
jgi:hypothetical protein